MTLMILFSRIFAGSSLLRKKSANAVPICPIPAKSERSAISLGAGYSSGFATSPGGLASVIFFFSCLKRSPVPQAWQNWTCTSFCFAPGGAGTTCGAKSS
eukprot:UN19592